MHLLLWLLAAIAAVAALLLLYLAWVARRGRPAAIIGLGTPDPASGPADVPERLARLQSLDTPEYNVPCGTTLVEPPPGVEPKGTIVYFHGFTNCPAQFKEAGEELVSRGWRVLAPRAPYHGNRDRVTRDLSKLTVAGLVDHVNMAVDAATGFPGPLYLTGLSGGGVLAAWGAATRPEVTGLLCIAPIAAPAGMPLFIVRAFVADRSTMPDIYWWWDPRQKEKLGEGQYVYPGFPFRSLQPYLHMAAALETGQVVPAHELSVANLQLNQADTAVRRDAARRMVSRSSDHARRAEEVVLGKWLGWSHDYIDQHGPQKGTPEQIADAFLAGLDESADPLAGGLIAYREPLADGFARGDGFDDARLGAAAPAGSRSTKG